MKRIMAAFAAALLSIGITHAAKPVCDAGTLDSSFGAGGSVALAQPYIGTFSTEGILLDRKDRTVVPVDSPVDAYGNVTISLVRTTDKGLPDKDFGANGRVAVTTAPAGMPVAMTLAEDRTGRILFLVVSNPWGGLFPGPSPVADATLTVYRLLENGQPDTSFGTAGSKSIGGPNSVFPIVSITGDADSRVLIALGAWNPTTNRIESTLFRLTASGALDATFGSGGTVQAALGTLGPDRATDVHVQADGRILILGRTRFSSSNWDFYAMRFLSNGTVDTSYGTNGSTSIDFGLNQANGRKGQLQPDGKLVVAGNVNWTPITPPTDSLFSYAGWVRLNTDGSRDTTFGINGQASIPFGPYGGILWGADLQDDGKIVGAWTQFLDAGTNNNIAGVMRINADGTLDTTYAADGVVNLLPAGYVGSSGSYLRVDSKNRTVLHLNAGNADGLGASFLARFEPGKQGSCK